MASSSFVSWTRFRGSMPCSTSAPTVHNQPFSRPAGSHLPDGAYTPLGWHVLSCRRGPPPRISRWVRSSCRPHHASPPRPTPARGCCPRALVPSFLAGLLGCTEAQPPPACLVEEVVNRHPPPALNIALQRSTLRPKMWLACDHSRKKRRWVGRNAPGRMPPHSTVRSRPSSSAPPRRDGRRCGRPLDSQRLSRPRAR